FAFAGFSGCTLASFLIFAHAAFLRQVFFLAGQQLGLGLGLLFAASELVLVDHRLGRRIVDGRLVTLDESALLAHLDLDRACLAGRVGLLDLAGRLARQRDLLAFGAGGGAVGRAQVIEQTLLVR